MKRSFYIPLHLIIDQAGELLPVVLPTIREVHPCTKRLIKCWRKPLYKLTANSRVVSQDKFKIGRTLWHKLLNQGLTDGL